MITETTMLYLYVETSLHAGVGSGLSSIDMPIQRERATQYPMIQSTGIKGKLRAAIEWEREKLSEDKKNEVDILFGPPAGNGQGSEHAGALIAGDARILLFPVRSLNGVFAYTTSCNVLARFLRDIERGQGDSTSGGNKPSWQIPDQIKNKALVATTSDIQANNTIVLEEFSFAAEASIQVDAIGTWLADHTLPDPGVGDYWRNKIKKSLVILPEDDFRDFTLHATEIITRIRINRGTKTVDNGALWTEEHLPPDTLLYTPIYATNARKKGATLTASQVLTNVKSQNINYLQLGGDETVGRGLVRVRWGS